MVKDKLVMDYYHEYVMYLIYGQVDRGLVRHPHRITVLFQLNGGTQFHRSWVM